ncbi:MAG: hypothetical protein J7L66_01285 [Anaerolineaceae bacterium]|nr:hypothetical protein [Anaerolineaceae bacterium]
MKFYPKRRFITFWAFFSLIVSCGMMLLSFHSFGLATIISALLFFTIFVFLIIPVIKNQVVDVHGRGIIIFNYGKGLEFNSNDLFEIVSRKGGVLSYRFKKGTYRFQISPCGYYDGKNLQDQFNELFSAFNK